jgi:hypothetical protein
MLVLMKCLVTVLFCVLGIFLYMTAVGGRELARLKRERVNDVTIKLRAINRTFHEINANASFEICFVSVVLTEIFVRLNGGVSPENKQLFWVHLGFALPLILSLATLRFWLTGIHSPRIHKWLGYLCLTSYIGTFLTGMILLWK